MENSRTYKERIGEIWNEADLARLKELAKQNTPVNRVANELQRSILNVILKLQELSGLRMPVVNNERREKLMDQSLTATDIYPNRGRTWSRMDDEKLYSDFISGKDIDDLCMELGRSKTALQMRLELHLRDTKKRDEAYMKAKQLLGMKKLEDIKTKQKIVQDSFDEHPQNGRLKVRFKDVVLDLKSFQMEYTYEGQMEGTYQTTSKYILKDEMEDVADKEGRILLDPVFTVKNDEGGALKDYRYEMSFDRWGEHDIRYFLTVVFFDDAPCGDLDDWISEHVKDIAFFSVARCVEWDF